MYLYNVTVNVEKEMEEEWLDWMKAVHIPDVLATGMFVENKLFKIMHDSEDGSLNYSVQYFAESMDHIMNYQQNFAPKLQAETQKKYGDRLVIFRTLLKLV
ncbi:DUF4286 family protein [Mongoliitalea lutea]|uniref:DUF4286 domain-containing protein n=1 Tax=Mongoliitalea lutea TaxID=849756 RepID=A0A8J3D091_9BACT|nr:DUF4286 family protein [Mongoliitalea lutea]GHB47055.1 hypothetical protein GCM10008106_29960 [Mongoliitalea lutea]